MWHKPWTGEMWVRQQKVVKMSRIIWNVERNWYIFFSALTLLVGRRGKSESFGENLYAGKLPWNFTSLITLQANLLNKPECGITAVSSLSCLGPKLKGTRHDFGYLCSSEQYTDGCTCAFSTCISGRPWTTQLFTYLVTDSLCYAHPSVCSHFAKWSICHIVVVGNLTFKLSQTRRDLRSAPTQCPPSFAIQCLIV